MIENSKGIKIYELEIYGPAIRITGAEASENRHRVTGTDNETGCGWFETEEDCWEQDNCEWNEAARYCLGEEFSYYLGHGISIKNSSDVNIG